MQCKARGCLASGPSFVRRRKHLSRDSPGVPTAEERHLQAEGHPTVPGERQSRAVAGRAGRADGRSQGVSKHSEGQQTPHGGGLPLEVTLLSWGFCTKTLQAGGLKHGSVFSPCPGDRESRTKALAGPGSLWGARRQSCSATSSVRGSRHPLAGGHILPTSVLSSHNVTPGVSLCVLSSYKDASHWSWGPPYPNMALP